MRLTILLWTLLFVMVGGIWIGLASCPCGRSACRQAVSEIRALTTLARSTAIRTRLAGLESDSHGELHQQTVFDAIARAATDRHRVKNRDPWGSTYRFRRGSEGIAVLSNGPDRKPQTADDLTRDSTAAPAWDWRWFWTTLFVLGYVGGMWGIARASKKRAQGTIPTR